MGDASGLVEGFAADGTRYRLQPGPGPVVVLVHGLGLDLDMWRFQRDVLAEDFTVLTYDLVGSGKSAKPAETPSLSLFSDQLARLLDALGIDRAAVAGFSLGGMIARRFAMDHPDRLWALAILHSAYKRDQAAHDAIQARVHQARENGPQATVEAALGRWFSEAYREANPAVMDWVRDTILANDKAVYPGLYQVLVDGVDELAAPEPPIATRTLVMTGDEDYGNSVEMANAIAAEIPDCSTVILRGLRHMAMVEAPVSFNDVLLTFLRDANGAVAA